MPIEWISSDILWNLKLNTHFSWTCLTFRFCFLVKFLPFHEKYEYSIESELGKLISNQKLGFSLFLFLFFCITSRWIYCFRYFYVNIEYPSVLEYPENRRSDLFEHARIMRKNQLDPKSRYTYRINQYSSE